MGECKRAVLKMRGASSARVSPAQCLRGLGSLGDRRRRFFVRHRFVRWRPGRRFLSLQPREQDLAALFRLLSRDGFVSFSDARAFHDPSVIGTRKTPLDQGRLSNG